MQTCAYNAGYAQSFRIMCSGVDACFEWWS